MSGLGSDIHSSHHSARQEVTIQACLCWLSGCYGSTKRYKSFERLRKINSKTVIGAGGELSDFQYIMTLLEELMKEDFCLDDDIEMSPREVFAYLNRVIYNRRTK